MKTNERILRINSVLQDYFIKHPQSGMVLAKEFMPLFIKNGIFNKDYREGLPIRKVLRALDTENSLDKIPYVHAERKSKITNWYFRPLCLLIWTISAIFISCSSNKDSINDNYNTSFPEVSHIAFQTDKDGKWGLIGIDGKVLFQNEFDSKMELSYAVNGVFRVWDNDMNRFLYYSATNGPELIGTPKGYRWGGICSEGVIPVVSLGERIHYITETGETAFYLLPYEGKEFLMVSSFFTEKRAWFQLENGKCGYIDPQGNVVVEPIYDNAFPFHEGKAIVYDKENDKWFAINVNGKVLFEVKSNGQHQYSPALYNDGYCLIENFLLDKKGKEIQNFPSDICYISPFINGSALYQDANTGFWGQINMQGKNIIKPKYPYALGFSGDWMFVGDTITQQRDKKGNHYMNVYAIDSKGKVQTEIKNISCFHPLSKSVIVAKNSKYYFADKNGNPINNNLYHKLSVPSHTGAPSPSYLWTFLIGPRSHADYNVWEVRTDYIDKEKTVNSILEKLTLEGVGKIKMGQTFSQLADLFKLYNDNNYLNIRNYDDWLFLNTKDYGINYIYATYAVCGIINWAVRVIRMKINTNDVPVDDISELIAREIPLYLTQTLGMTRDKYDEDEGCYLYHSEKYAYKVIHYEGETELLLVSTQD